VATVPGAVSSNDNRHTIETAVPIGVSSVVLAPAWATWQRATKRIIDVFIAALALIILAPVMALIAICIRLDTPGPVLFRQFRCGRDGKLFVFLKFRGMVAGAETLRETLESQNEADGPIFKIRNDPRLTRVGRVLRRTSLDELPQLWNVLRGDMSLIGPRPPVPDEVARYEAWQLDRLLVPGGISGLWQVSGRSEMSFAEMVQLDLTYIEQWSLWLDLVILLRTVAAVFTMRGAY
jgi:exopolysaccharide biosynthesis polyprenyl glycosylphosphotransferase